jgi:hypothetical protein
MRGRETSLLIVLTIGEWPSCPEIVETTDTSRVAVGNVGVNHGRANVVVAPQPLNLMIDGERVKHFLTRRSDTPRSIRPTRVGACCHVRPPVVVLLREPDLRNVARLLAVKIELRRLR